MDEEWWDGVESLPQGQLKLHPFPGWILAKAISMTHFGMLYRLDISVFYFMSHCCFRFLSLGNLGLPLSTVTYIQYEISFFIKIYNMKSVFLITIHVKIFYIQIWFKYEAPLLCFRIKTMINKNHFLNIFSQKQL